MRENIQEKSSKMSEFFNQKLSKNAKTCIFWVQKSKIFLGEAPPPPLLGRLRLLFRRLANIPAENPSARCLSKNYNHIAAGGLGGLSLRTALQHLLRHRLRRLSGLRPLQGSKQATCKRKEDKASF